MARDKTPSRFRAVNAPPWVTTYGGLATLMLALFAFLFSVSSIDADKWRQMTGIFSGAASLFETAEQNETPPSAQTRAPDRYLDAEILSDNGGKSEESRDSRDSEWDVLLGELETFSLEHDFEDRMMVQQSELEITVRFYNNSLFAAGSADLLPEATDVISRMFDDVILPRIGELAYIRIEGHTDSQPISTTRFQDNWDLSIARARAVHRFVLDNVPEVAPEQLSYSGYGEYHPIAPNDSAENMQMNRRVDIVLVRPLHQYLDELETD